MRKYFFITLILIFISELSFSQIEYGYEKSSKDPWNYGVKIDGTYDGSTQSQGITKKFGFKVGFVAEKHLIYNIYFQPSLTLNKKGFESEIKNGYSNKINGFFFDFDASIQLKFGDERYQKGFLISLTPYFTYGLWGNTEQTDLQPTSATFNQTSTYKTFDVIKKEDVGFLIGAGYDFNKHWEINANYYFGLLRLQDYNNFRWRGITIGLEYFF